MGQKKKGREREDVDERKGSGFDFKSWHKIVLILMALVFGFGVVLISLMRVTWYQVYGGVGGRERAGRTKEGVFGRQREGTDYYLPNPGILPDHPLYWLKMIRDRVVLILARGPEAKMERYWLYADKRIGAAEALVEKGKVQLGVTTATKAEKYLSQAVGEFEKKYKNGEGEILKVKKKLMKAMLKHKEILEEILGEVEGKNESVLAKALESLKIDFGKVYHLGERDGEAEKLRKEMEK